MAPLTEQNSHDKRTIQRVSAIKPDPVDPSYNASYDLTWSGGNLTQIDMVIDGVTFRRTLTYDGSDQLDTVSVWSEV